MRNPTRPALPPEAITIAMRQLLDHIDDHGLPLPINVRLPGLHTSEPRLAVDLLAADLDAWQATVEIDDERVDHRVANGKPWAMARTECRLPVGVQLVLCSAVLVDAEVLSHG